MKNRENGKADLNLGGGWNYRVIFHPSIMIKQDKGDDLEVLAYFAIHEVYYTEAGEPSAYSTNPEIVSEEIENIDSQPNHHDAFNSLESILEMMAQALKKEVLRDKDFGI